VRGGAGYIGSHTAAELLSRGYEIVIYDNLSNSDAGVIKNIEAVAGARVRFVRGDLLDEALLNKVFKKEKFDAVIHFAGLKAVGESVAKPLLYYQNNVSGTVNLLNAMQAYGVRTIVFSSSATVYGNQKAPYTEDLPLSVTNPYGGTKLIIENMLKDLAAADKGFNAIILRYFNPIGAHESGLLGENPRGIPNNLAPYIMQVASGKREFLGIFGNDYKTADGTGVRDYIHVVDLALGHIAALEKCSTAGVHVYNLGTGKGTSVLELHSAFEKAVGKAIPYKILPRRAGDIDVSLASPEKAKKDLGFEATRTIEDMCRSSWAFISKK
jgi:UDP-glucose 4-epimerase